MKNIAIILSSLLSLVGTTTAFFSPSLFNAPAKRSELKTKILDLATTTKRGLIATPEQKQELLSLFEQLEKLNPTKNPLSTSKVNGNWSLQYTTSDSILGKGELFPRVGPIVQYIDTTNLEAKNSEVISVFGVNVPRSVKADLAPESGQFTNVKFKRFVIGPEPLGLKIDVPNERFRGSLDVTYLDDEMRLTRGDKGNIFVLTKM